MSRETREALAMPRALQVERADRRGSSFALRAAVTSRAIGRTTWAIPEGYIPPAGRVTSRELVSHETACLLNTGDQDAHVSIMIYFTSREPIGPYRIVVPARRTLHLRFNDLRDPEPIPHGTDYSSLIESDVPIVVQHTRLDSRQADEALLTTIAYSQ